MLVPKNLGQARLPTYPRTTTSKPPGLVSGSEGTRRGWITEKKSEPYECHIQQNKQNHSIRAGSRGLRVWPRAWVWWPPAWAGLPDSPPRPGLPRTVPKAPSAPALLAEASASHAALADILVFYGVFIFSFMVQLTIAQLLFESCTKMHKHQQERSAVNDRGTAPGASGGVGGGAVAPTSPRFYTTGSSHSQPWWAGHTHSQPHSQHRTQNPLLLQLLGESTWFSTEPVLRIPETFPSCQDGGESDRGCISPSGCCNK